jgi:hypothetical protein
MKTIYISFRRDITKVNLRWVSKDGLGDFGCLLIGAVITFFFIMSEFSVRKIYGWHLY